MTQRRQSRNEFREFWRPLILTAAVIVGLVALAFLADWYFGGLLQ